VRLDNFRFQQANQNAVKVPRMVVRINFGSTLIPDYVYFTDDVATATPAAAVVHVGVLKITTQTSQRLNLSSAISQIGHINLEIVDISDALTTLFNAKLVGLKGLRRQTVEVFQGFGEVGVAGTLASKNPVIGELPWEDYVLTATQLIIKDAYKNGTYKISCTDFSRITDKKLFVPKITTLFSTISDLDTSIELINSTEFDLIEHGSSYTDAPNQLVGYVQIDQEIISYSGKTSNTLTGCVRGRFNTKPATHEVDVMKAVAQRTRVTEYIYLEMPAVKLALAVLTGQLYNQVGSLPLHWHLDVEDRFVRSSDFVNIGIDWWDPLDDRVGRSVVFRGKTISSIKGQEFLTRRLYRESLGALSPIYNNGSFGLKRQAAVLRDVSPVMLLDESIVKSVGELLRDHDAVRNNFHFKWNFEPGLGYTRNTIVDDPVSIATHGRSKLLTIEALGLHGSIRTEAEVISRFDTLRDRFVSPPLLITVVCTFEANALEVGDIVQLKLDKVKEYSKGVNPLDSSFEVQQISVDWANHVTTLLLFASTSVAAPLAIVGGTTTLPNSFYNSKGIDLVNFLSINFPGKYSDVSGLLTITGNVTLPGAISMNIAASIYYYLGDVTVDSGVSVFSSGNLQLRNAGFLQLNGLIILTGGGRLGQDAILPTGSVGQVYDPPAPTFGLVGQAYRGPGLNRLLLTGATDAEIFQDTVQSTGNKTIVVINQVDQTFSWGSSAFPAIDLIVTGTEVLGIPNDFRGTPGGGGDPVRLSEVNGGPFALGGKGGTAGGGLVTINQGISMGASGVVITNGLPGAEGVAVTSTIGNIRTFKAGNGGPGGPGAWLCLIDGRLSTIGTLNLQAEYGDNLIPAGHTLVPTTFPPEQVSDLASPLYGAPQWISKNLNLSAFKVQYLPGDSNPVADTPQPAEDALVISLLLITNSPKRPNADLSSIEVTAEPPNPITNYSHSMVYYKLTTETDWTVGGIAKDEYVISGLAANGTAYDVQLRSVSIGGVEAPAGPKTVITLNDIEGAPEVVIVIPNITGLEIFDIGQGKGNDNTFTGKEVKIRWNRSSIDQSIAFGSEPGVLGAGAGSQSGYFNDYEVQVWDTNTDVLLRTEFLQDPTYLYTYEKNALDNSGTAQREIRFEIYARGRQNQRSEMPARLSVINPAPGVPTGIALKPLFKTIWLTFTAPADDLDYQFVEIYISTSPGFTKDATTLVTTLREADEFIIGALGNGTSLSSGTSYYVALQAVDAFGGVGATSVEVMTTTIAEINGEFDIQSQSIKTAQIGLLQVTSALINSLTVNKLTSGQISSADIEISAGGVLHSEFMTAFGVGKGFWMDDASGSGRFSLGDMTNEKGFTFDGNDFELLRATKMIGADAYNNDAYYLSDLFINGWYTTLISGGSVSAGSEGVMVIDSGATVGDKAEAYYLPFLTLDTFTWAQNRRFKIIVTAPVTGAEVAVTTGDDSATNNGLGFRFRGGTIYGKASKLSPSGETEVVLLAYTSGTFYVLEIDFISGTKVDFFVDGILENTITVDLPTGTVFANTLLSVAAENVTAQGNTTVGQFKFNQQ